MRLACVVLAGCSFGAEIPTATPSDGDPDAVPAEATPGSEPAVPFCVPEAALRACYAFDNTTEDGSSYNNDAVSSTNGYLTGHDGAGKGIVTTSGTITVGNTTSLDVAMFTIKLWMRANTLPTGGARAGLVDSGGRFRLFLQSDGALRCAITGGTDLTTATGVVDASTWHRVTCTFTGSQMRIYVDGTMVGTSNTASTVPATGGGMVIGHNNPSGENLNGAIDDLQIWSAVVPP